MKDRTKGLVARERLLLLVTFLSDSSQLATWRLDCWHTVDSASEWFLLEGLVLGRLASEDYLLA